MSTRGRKIEDAEMKIGKIPEDSEGHEGPYSEGSRSSGFSYVFDTDDEESDRPMSHDEKKRLSQDINKLSGDMLGKLVHILIHSGDPSVQGGDLDELEIDFEILLTSTLRKLESFVASCLIPRVKPVVPMFGSVRKRVKMDQASIPLKKRKIDLSTLEDAGLLPESAASTYEDYHSRNTRVSQRPIKDATSGVTGKTAAAYSETATLPKLISAPAYSIGAIASPSNESTEVRRSRRISDKRRKESRPFRGKTT